MGKFVDQFKRLEKISSVAALSHEERVQYERDVKKARDYRAEIGGAWDEGRAEGRAEERRELARKLFAATNDEELVRNITGLSREDLE